MQNNALWTEKYRPSDFSEIKGQREIVKRVKAFVEQQNLPHLMFAGPAGVGKTSLSLVIAKKLFGDLWRQNFLELNASDERGIDIIRNKVKDFARTRAIGNVQFKIIYLDECLDYNTKIEIKHKSNIKKIKLGDFVNDYEVLEGAGVASIHENGEKIFVKIKEVINIVHNKNEGFYKITIHDNTIKATGNHLLLTKGGWRRVDELKEGDLVLSSLHLEQQDAISNPNQLINFELIGLPQEIKKKERYIEESPEKKIIELLAHNEMLSYQEIAKQTSLSKPKISGILNVNAKKEYLSLPSLGIVKRDGNLAFSLSLDKGVAIERLKDAKRRQNTKNLNYVRNKLSSLDLYPLKKEKALTISSILGHLFSDGSLVFKNRAAFFSGKLEDMEEIKNDVLYLGFKAGDIKHKTWKNGECWTFISSDIAFLSLLYSLGAPVGKKTDNYFILPNWLLYEDKDIKKEFIGAFFGGEACKPMFQGRTPKPILVSQSKREDLLQNLSLYLDQWKMLLEEFGLEVEKKILPNIKSIRKDGTCTREGYIWVKNNRKN